MISRHLDIPVGILVEEADYQPEDLETIQKLVRLIKSKNERPQDYEHAKFVIEKLSE